MPNCVVKGCSSNSTNPHYDESGRKVTLHQFPTKVTRAEWISILRERGGRSPGWEPNANAKICSMHFDEADIDRTGQCVRIKAYAVPVYFSSLKRKSRKRHSEEAADAPTWAQQPPPSLIPIGKIEVAPFQSAPLPAIIIKEDKPLQPIAPAPPMVLVPTSSPAPLTPVPPLVPVSKAMAPIAAAPAPEASSPSPPVKLLLEVTSSAVPPPLTMVSKEVPIASKPTSAPSLGSSTSVRSMHLLTTKATLEPISSPILGSIMRGTPLTKREQMLNSPAVTSTLVEKCIRRSKKFQELVSGEKDPSILRGIISKTLKDVNFYDALKNNLNCEKERQMNDAMEKELRADMIMQEMKALTSTTKYALQEAQGNFENFFKMDLDMARSKVKILRTELQRNYFILADKWERMAQIIEGETRKYESPAAAPVSASATNGSDVFVAVSNGVVNTSNPGLGPKQQHLPQDKAPKVSRHVHLQHLQASTSAVAPTPATAIISSQEMSDSVDAATAMVALLTQLPPMPAGHEAKDFNPKTYLPKKHKAMLKLAEEQMHGRTCDPGGGSNSDGSNEAADDVETVRKKIKVEDKGSSECLAL